MTKKETANTSKQPKATFTRSRIAILLNARRIIDAHLKEALEITKNGTLKVTSATPVAGDKKGTVKCNGKTFYIVPGAPGKKGMFSNLISFLDIVEARRIEAKKASKALSFEAWLASNEGQSFMAGLKITLQFKPDFDVNAACEKQYNCYRAGLGLEPVPTAKPEPAKPEPTKPAKPEPTKPAKPANKKK